MSLSSELWGANVRNPNLNWAETLVAQFLPMSANALTGSCHTPTVTCNAEVYNATARLPGIADETPE